MDIGQIGDDAWTSLRTSWREEAWLPAGGILAAVVYPLWLGLTGAAVSFLAGAIAGDVTIQPWTSMTTALVALLGLLWVVGPAALATALTVGRVTNYNDNLRTGYRLRHPLLLLGPPLLVLGLGLIALAGTRSAGIVPMGLLLAGAVWGAVRTTAYAYRVFSLSLPLIAWGLLFATASAISVATLVLGGLAIGRTALVADLLAGLATETGVTGLGSLHTSTVGVAGVGIPTVLAAPIAVSVGGSLGYVAVQLPWSVVVRLWRPTVRRPELRTGQRYPRFARPTTSASPSNVSRAGRTTTPDASTGAADQTDGTGGGDEDASDASRPASVAADDGSDDETPEPDDEMDDVTHTRVFTAPDDADVAAPADLVDDASEDADTSGATGSLRDRETTVTDGSTPGGPCPDCGTSVAATATVCPDCGTDLESA